MGSGDSEISDFGSNDAIGDISLADEEPIPHPPGPPCITMELVAFAAVQENSAEAIAQVMSSYRNTFYDALQNVSAACAPRILLGGAYLPPSPLPPAPPEKIDCSCEDAASQPPMTATVLGHFFETIGPLPSSGISASSDQCRRLRQGSSLCTYELLSDALRQGQFRLADLGPLVHGVGNSTSFGSNVTSTSTSTALPPLTYQLAREVCHNVTARVCLCAACWQTQPTTVNLTLLRHNQVDMRFSEPVVTITGASVALDDLVVHVDNWSYPPSSTRQDIALATINDGVMRLNVSLTPTTRGTERLLVRSALRGPIIFGALGGAIPLQSPLTGWQIDYREYLKDLTPPTFQASGTGAGGETTTNVTEGTIRILFSEPCFGNGPLGTILGDHWQLSVDGGLATASARVRRVWFESTSTADPSTTNDSDTNLSNATVHTSGLRLLQAAPATNPNLGTVQMDIDIILRTTATGAISYVPSSTALVYFIGPAPERVADRAGNWLQGVSTGALPPFIMPLPPPDAAATLEALSSAAIQSNFSLLVSALVAAILVLLYCAYILERYRRKQRKAQMTMRDLVKLNKLDLIFSHEHERHSNSLNGTDAEAHHLLAKAMTRAVERRRPLTECAREVFLEHLEDSSLSPWQQMVVGTAYTAYYDRHLTPADGDREAFETLLSMLHDASMPLLQLGTDGGGGVRVKPMRLQSPASRAPWQEDARGHTLYDESALPPCVLEGARALGHESEGALATTQERLHAMRQLLEEQAVLPPTISAALIATHFCELNVASVHCKRQRSNSTPTEGEQIELLGWLLNCRVSAAKPVEAHGGGVRLPPLKLLPALGLAGSGASVEPDSQPSGESEAELTEDEEEGEVITARKWLQPGPNGQGGVRIAPPRLDRPVRSHAVDGLILDDEVDDEAAMSETQLCELQATVSPLNSELSVPGRGSVGGGARLPPPKLLPFMCTFASSLLDGNESEVLDWKPRAELQQSSASNSGGWLESAGSVRIAPPKLLPAQPVRLAIEDEEEPLSSLSDDDSTGEQHSEDIIHPADHLKMVDVEMQGEQLTLAGGGARVFPPRLLPYEAYQTRGILAEDTMEGRPVLLSSEYIPLAAAVVATAAAEEAAGGAASPHPPSGVEVGGGARVLPPKLLPVSIAVAAAASEVMASGTISNARRREDDRMRARKLQSSLQEVIRRRRMSWAFVATEKRLKIASPAFLLRLRNSAHVSRRKWVSLPDGEEEANGQYTWTPRDRSELDPDVQRSTSVNRELVNELLSPLVTPLLRPKQVSGRLLPRRMPSLKLRGSSTARIRPQTLASPPPSPPEHGTKAHDVHVELPVPIERTLKAECRRLGRPVSIEEACLLALELKNEYESAMHHEGSWGRVLNFESGRDASAALDGMTLHCRQRAERQMSPDEYRQLKIQHTWQALQLAVDAVVAQNGLEPLSQNTLEVQRQLVRAQLKTVREEFDSTWPRVPRTQKVAPATASPASALQPIKKHRNGIRSFRAVVLASLSAITARRSRRRSSTRRVHSCASASAPQQGSSNDEPLLSGDESHELWPYSSADETRGSQMFISKWTRPP